VRARMRESERGGIRDSQTERQRGGEEGRASANGGRGDALECGHALESLLPEEVEEKEQCHVCVRERACTVRLCVCMHIHTICIYVPMTTYSYIHMYIYIYNYKYI